MICPLLDVHHVQDDSHDGVVAAAENVPSARARPSIPGGNRVEVRHRSLDEILHVLHPPRRGPVLRPRLAAALELEFPFNECTSARSSTWYRPVATRRSTRMSAMPLPRSHPLGEDPAWLSNFITATVGLTRVLSLGQLNHPAESQPPQQRTVPRATNARIADRRFCMNLLSDTPSPKVYPNGMTTSL